MNAELKHRLETRVSVPQALNKNFWKSRNRHAASPICTAKAVSCIASYISNFIGSMRRVVAAAGLFLVIVLFAQAEPVDQRLGQRVHIEAGTYWVGDDEAEDNKPYRQVSVEGFYIDIHPVTNDQYLQFLADSLYKPKGTFDAAKAEKSPLLPAGGLVYADAEAYAKYYRKRLPTEWEWEIAARSLTKENVYVYPDAAYHESGHFLFNKEYYKLPVFSYPPNALGLYGMAGNVFEWTSSEYEEKYLYGKYFKGQTLKILRGGSWTNKAFDIRATTRTPFPAGRCLEWIGFRCVSTASPGASS